MHKMFTRLSLASFFVFSCVSVNAQHSKNGASTSGARARWIKGGESAGTAQWNGHTEALVNWNECEGRLQGGYNGDYTTQLTFAKKNPNAKFWKSSSDVQIPAMDCKDRPVSAALFKFMDQQFPKCVGEASGIKESDISSLKIAHVGVRGDDRHRSSSAGSYHNINRAIDVTGFTVKSSNEKSSRTYNHAMGAYANYKLQLGEKLSAAESQQLKFWNDFYKCVEKNGGGAISFENAKHQGHIHVSVPSADLIDNHNFYKE